MQKQGGSHWRRGRFIVPFLRRLIDYSLRAYQGDQSRDWPEVSYAPMPGLPPLTIPAMRCALGHEETPEAFIGHLVACYREVKRVLRDDGVCWVVIGDSYASQGGPEPAQTKWQIEGASDGQANGKSRRTGSLKQGNLMLIPHRLALALQADGWTVRNDCVFAKVAPMPESIQGTRWTRCRVKVAPGRPATNQEHLPDDGKRPGGNRGNQWGDVQNQPNAKWQDCPGCPRCEAHGGYVLRRGSFRMTRAHEAVLHLTKGMGYWSDGEAVREGLAQSSIDRINQPTFDQQTGGAKDYGSGVNTNRSMRKTLENFSKNPSGRNPRSVLSAPEQLVTLRQDLSEEDRNYVLKRLAENGLL